MQIHPKTKQAASDIAGYIMNHYGGSLGVVRAADAVSAVGALAGVFAQSQARSLITARLLPSVDNTIERINAPDGSAYYVGVSIYLCLFEGGIDWPSFWSLVSPVAQDPNITKVIDLREIAKHAVDSIGAPEFGRPRIDSRYRLSEMPIDAVRAHGGNWWRHFRDTDFDAGQLMIAFGLAAQALGPLAAGEVSGVLVDVPMTRADIVRLYVESALPMSAIDLIAVGMVQ